MPPPSKIPTTINLLFMFLIFVLAIVGASSVLFSVECQTVDSGTTLTTYKFYGSEYSFSALGSTTYYDYDTDSTAEKYPPVYDSAGRFEANYALSIIVILLSVPHMALSIFALVRSGSHVLVLAWIVLAVLIFIFITAAPAAVTDSEAYDMDQSRNLLCAGYNDVRSVGPALGSQFSALVFSIIVVVASASPLFLRCAMQD